MAGNMAGGGFPTWRYPNSWLVGEKKGEIPSVEMDGQWGLPRAICEAPYGVFTLPSVTGGSKSLENQEKSHMKLVGR